MPVNVGSPDRIARLILGLVLLVVALFGGLPIFDGGALKYIAVAVGAILVLTAVFRFCPLYRILGVKTCKV